MYLYLHPHGASLEDILKYLNDVGLAHVKTSNQLYSLLEDYPYLFQSLENSKQTVASKQTDYPSKWRFVGLPVPYVNS